MKTKINEETTYIKQDEDEEKDQDRLEIFLNNETISHCAIPYIFIFINSNSGFFCSQAPDHWRKRIKMNFFLVVIIMLLSLDYESPTKKKKVKKMWLFSL